MNWYWLGDKSTYLIPIDEISFNTSLLGNHPSIEAIRNYLDEIGIPSCGRFGEWKYIRYHAAGE